MPIRLVAEKRRIWQEIAEAYRPPNDAFALYAQDQKVGEYHAATLAINFTTGVNTLSMHNAWGTGDWFGPYPLRVPHPDRLVGFPRMVTPEEAAEAIGYEIPASSGAQLPQPGFDSEVPEWVKAYHGYLLNQIDLYGHIVRRELRRDAF